MAIEFGAALKRHQASRLNFALASLIFLYTYIMAVGTTSYHPE